MAAKKRGGDDEQVTILRAIWNEMKSLNGRVEQTNARLDQTNARLDQTNERLDTLRADLGQRVEHLENSVDSLRRRTVESEVRLATATTQYSAPQVRDRCRV